MKGELRASAPGKLVLVGEYAVLNGGPALAAAVSVRANAHLIPLAGRYHELYIVNSGDTFQFSCTAEGNVSWLEEPGANGAILVAVIETLNELGVWRDSTEAFRISLDSHTFYQRGADGTEQKLGLGSSAAVCAALTGVLLRYFDISPDYKILLTAHRRLQAGRGSGIDVASSYFGGVVSFCRPTGKAAEIHPLSWPAGLHVLPVWSGEAASTTDMLDLLAAYQFRHPDDYQSLMADLCAASSYAVAQWEAGQPESILAALQDFSDRLQTLDAAAGVGIWAASHTRMGKIAAESGAVYKPSGAGGGDFGLAFSSDESQLKKLAEKYKKHGYFVADLGFACAGAEVSQV